MLRTKNTPRPTRTLLATRPRRRRPPAAASPTSIARPQSLDFAILCDASLSTAYSRVGSPSKNSPPPPEKVCERYRVIFAVVSAQLIIV